ncbi:aminoacyl-histidine dipeptidase [Nonlabens ponticola]|uniref:Cytosol non-specific dipeptidase n=1 Tax=Nonlabens ponticola TaxID=2496866 RepID=A0A3S9MZP2_9FLAO|nr:aminoacyl-histidine dipeptidase [Nonlabens ponticola]AZQ44533.1 aminoacyl-histidine dipeptidase [Nonlabens ponticola]
MSKEIRELEPKSLWNHFADLNAVPRPSKQEERVRQFMLDFAAKHDLISIVDDIGNVIIKKGATVGMESRKSVILQSHLDMVHQKNNDTTFDFDTQGIDMLIENGHVTARGTTLGADNGIGVAAIMAILSSTDLPHPPIEALFTIDEETGMTGAKKLDQKVLTSSILLNLDTEEDDEIDVGCAGGVDITGTRNYVQEGLDNDFKAHKITVKGLKGGHSGMDIHKGLANANKIITRLMDAMRNNGKIHLQEFNGGGLRNAIPREAVSVVSFRESENKKIIDAFKRCKTAILAEYESLEPNMSIEIESTESHKALSEIDTANLIYMLLGIVNGVYRWSPDFDDLVQSSNNLARVVLEDGALEVACLSRSSVESQKDDLKGTIAGVMRLNGLDVEFTGDYPGWQPNLNSEMLKIAEAQYKILFQEKPRVVACHAGLECGILGERYPGLDMISFGPNIRRAHSPDEFVEIKSVQKFWKFLKEILKETPVLN